MSLGARERNSPWGTICKSRLLQDKRELDAYWALLISIGHVAANAEYEQDGDGDFTSHDAVVILRQAN